MKLLPLQATGIVTGAHLDQRKEIANSVDGFLSAEPAHQCGIVSKGRVRSAITPATGGKPRSPMGER